MLDGGVPRVPVDVVLVWKTTVERTRTAKGDKSKWAKISETPEK